MAFVTQPQLTADESTTTIAGGVIQVKAPHRAQDHLSVQPSQAPRATEFAYQNTGARALVVIVSANMVNTGGDHRLDVLIGEADPPTTNVGTLGRTSGTDTTITTITFIVPPGFYYMLTATGTACTVREWTEYPL